MAGNPLQEFLSQFRIPFLGENLLKKYEIEKSPLRSELLSTAQLELYAESLARTHVTGKTSIPEQLIGRLSENEEILAEVRQLLIESAQESSPISPAGEWLLDNFYLIEEQIQTGRKHFPKGYSDTLPKLTKGIMAGYPRVYHLALELISHVDGRVDMENLLAYVEAYQRVAPLNLGELWAIPIMLRLALIENLRRLAAQMAVDRINRNLAGTWADRMIEIAEKDPKSLIVITADMARSNPPMASSFVAEITRRLLGKGPSLNLPLTWIEQRLSENGLSTNSLVLLENQRQASAQVSMSNSISSLRFLTSTDWRVFVERTSLVERLLREQGDAVYPKMDFQTRDRYRHKIEALALQSKKSEIAVTSTILTLCNRYLQQNGSDARKSHVGYFLVDKGIKETDLALGIQLSRWEKIRRMACSIPLFWYIGSIMVITISFAGFLVHHAYKEGLSNWWIALVALLALTTMSQLAITLINWISTIMVKPDFLSRLDYETTIPPESKTLVVVPTLIGSVTEVDDLMETMEVRYLSNPQDHLHYALLTDFRDADHESIEEENEILEFAKQRVDELNRKYNHEEYDTFFFFHRPRKWNEIDKKWMGYERKRGKLGELMALMRGGKSDPFQVIVGDIAVLQQAKFLITLDTDTQLPREAAWKIIGTIAHPLNRPVFNPAKNRVVEGYGILQPRIATSIAQSSTSWYAQLHASEPGIDPYTKAVSDVYQDVLKEGSYIGKGIIDIDAFGLAMDDRFPENRILSHDLLEGCHARSGLISDVQLYESYPATYLADMKRRHRWIRGDWQIARWLFPRVPVSAKQSQKNPISTLSKWKIADNLRRSLLPPSMLLLLLFGWFISPVPWFWTIISLGILFPASVIAFVYNLFKKPKDLSFSLHATATVESLVAQLLQQIWTIISLPYEAVVNIDAIIRTLWRITISHKNLLQWDPFTPSRNNKNVFEHYLTMWQGPVLSLAVITTLSAISAEAFIIATPVLITWLASPLVAWMISLPLTRKQASLSASHLAYLQKLSRNIWSYFTEYVNEENNWLPPDNFQEYPSPRVANRTSPTNIGLALLANLAAYDFKFITKHELIDRCSKTFTSLNKLDRFKGHFYNWYDTLSLAPLYPRYISTVDSGNLAASLLTLKEGLLSVKANHAEPDADKQQDALIDDLVKKCIDFATYEYDLLYDKTQHYLSIGYNVEEHRKDAGYYDLLGSEARLGVYVAIAQGKIPQESWFALGRQVTNSGTNPVLISWSGSMFEFLMPALLMPTYENTLIDQTQKGAVSRQIEYGQKRDLPWGISESCFNMFHANMDYQYRAFGVPGLGLKRGLGNDYVVAPYATFLALLVDPIESIRNLERLAHEGGEGRWGFYEALDYTAARIPRGQNAAIVKAFMTHHQGMSFLALSHVLNGQLMQKRFESDLHFQTSLLLLQEKIPKVTSFYTPAVDVGELPTETINPELLVINTANTPIPEVQLLSNGRYHIMVSNGGGGYSRWNDLAVTRWREDGTMDAYGNFCFIREMETGNTWSAAFQPTLTDTERYEVIFSQGRAEFRRRDQQIETHTEIVVSPEDDVELRRHHITNRSRRKRLVEITSYAEVVMNQGIAEILHPAFSNLFVQTQIEADQNAILCTRRPRSEDEHPAWMFHLMKVHGADAIEVSYETSRDEFIGRGNTIHRPKAIFEQDGLKGHQGSVLDPIVAIQYKIQLKPFETVTVDMIYGVGATHKICDELVIKYQDKHMADRAFELAWTHSQVALRQINATAADSLLYTRLAGSIIYANASLRAEANVISRNQRGQSGLWSHSISGDWPIVLLQIEDIANISIAQQMILAHEFWRLKGLTVDLVIWNEDHGGYRQNLQNQIISLITPLHPNDDPAKPGGIYVRSAEQLSNEDRILFQTVARVIISDKLGSLEGQLNRRKWLRPVIQALQPTVTGEVYQNKIRLPENLLFNNGFGGFSSDGREYVIVTKPDQITPAPWSNVLANPNFGTVISESGQSYTWFQNAHELRLTPWHNDPVTDESGEHFYIRDEQSGLFWSPAPLPARGKTPYITRHGFGYSVFEHTEEGIHSEMTVYVDPEKPIKYTYFKFRNESGASRQLSITGYVEWILGDLRNKTMMHVITETDMNSGAIIAHNSYHTEFGQLVAFFDTNETSRMITTDRIEFIGRNGTTANPYAMSRSKLSGKTGAALDPCGVIQVHFNLQEGEEYEVLFRLGTGMHMNDVAFLLREGKSRAMAREALGKINKQWESHLSNIEIKTPDVAVNLLANGWLNYQTLVCRMWARSGYYQSGGAFGFRDQLQDVMSIMHIQPSLARHQIVLSASRQFLQGDVQHWWHPPVGRGVRTRCSDDYLWLPYVTAKYVSVTGDVSILDEQIHFLESRELNADEHSVYDLPNRSDAHSTLYEHCLRALNHGLRFGSHGLPLIGSGDWNDGMDRVGTEGQGESVWLGWFLYDVLEKFIEVAQLRSDKENIKRYQKAVDNLKINLNEKAWDGAWYRRAYFDDGTPLGSKQNDECSIDAIAQSWSVISGAGDPEKSQSALREAGQRLVRKEDKIIQLLNPPFDKSKLNPGYIKGYVPGVRENGGQYTHAAIWMIMAYAIQKDREKMWELLNMVIPVNHGHDPESISVYKVEPYVIAADVYAVSEHTGRGGWTWYTGSAGWMYQLIIEYVIGLKKKGESIIIEPCLPLHWENVTVRYQYRQSLYIIQIHQKPDGDNHLSITLDERDIDGNVIPLVDDGREHQVEIAIGESVKV